MTEQSWTVYWTGFAITFMIAAGILWMNKTRSAGAWFWAGFGITVWPVTLTAFFCYCLWSESAKEWAAARKEARETDEPWNEG